MNALHSPVCFAETGLLPCPAEKKAAKLAATLNHHTFSGPVSQEESLNSTDFSLFPEQSRRISLHCRLYGGEGGIRTLGTPVNPCVCVVADSKSRAENFAANGQRLWGRKRSEERRVGKE